MLSKELISYIRTLSKRDTKNLSQKTLKAVEELGELAKKVLPFENAFATNHRVVTKTQIVEEVADTMLCLLSIAHDVGASDEDIESMVSRKASVWAEKQDAEIGLTFPIPYEIHITVQIAEHNDLCQKLTIEGFKVDCLDIGVKPIVIDLQDGSGENVMQDVMTSSKHFGDNNTVIEEVERITNALKQRCYKVVRQKVETVPWHPAAPRDKNASAAMPKDCYFECHFAVVVQDIVDQKLDRLAIANDLHKSRNIFKVYEDGTKIVMLTSRSYSGTYETFQKKIDAIKTVFAQYHYEIEKVIVEFSMYDTKVKHDDVWISARSLVGEPA
jgi:NTP pyrophosphatase (non-canonical NTP hydrolase)